jgi:SH3-like domain-containing protein
VDGQGNGRRADREPRGFLPRAGAEGPPWRRVRDWLCGDRADIDQEGLLTERTLMIAPRRTTHDDALCEPAAAGSQTDEARS